MNQWLINRTNFIKSTSAISAAIVLLIVCGYTFKQRWGGDNWKSIISSDGRGYYAYLPAVFIDGNFNYDSAIEYEKNTFLPEEAGNYLREHNGKIANQFFAGISLLLLPFFLTAYFFSWMFDYPITGYSQLFQYGVSIGIIFYLFIGLLFFRRFLLIYVREIPAAFAILFFGIGTNLFYYAHWEQSMSHAYSFAIISIFLYYGKTFFLRREQRDFIIACIMLAIVILIRPINIVLLFILPFLAGSISDFKTTITSLLKNPQTIFYGFLIFSAITFIQPLLFFFQTGNYFLYSYGPQGFNFTHPEILNVLFSYRKGLFVYAPMTFISLLSLPVIFRNNRFHFFSLLAFMMILIYVTASWRYWWYGGSFGNRPFIDYYPIFALLLGILINSIKSSFWKGSLFVMCSLCTYLNFIQTFQYKNFILHWDEMDKERYWKVFMKTNKKYMGIFFRENIVIDTSNGQHLITLTNDMEKSEKDYLTIAEKVHSGKRASKMDMNNKFSEGITMKMSEISENKHIGIKLSIWVMREDEDSDAQLVISFEDKDQKIYSWSSFPSTEYSDKTNEWEKLEFDMMMPQIKSSDDIMKIYMWSPQGYTTYVDDFKIELILMN